MFNLSSLIFAVFPQFSTEVQLIENSWIKAQYTVIYSIVSKEIQGHKIVQHCLLETWSPHFGKSRDLQTVFTCLSTAERLHASALYHSSTASLCSFSSIHINNTYFDVLVFFLSYFNGLTDCSQKLVELCMDLFEIFHNNADKTDPFRCRSESRCCLLCDAGL